MTDLPDVQPFRYVYIPAEDSAPASTREFTGNSEAALRAELTRHFRALLLSEDQKRSMSHHISEEANRNAEKHKKERKEESVVQLVEEGEEGSVAAAAPPPVVKQEELIDQFLEHNSFEVVPVVMPTRDTKFIGTSLYVDDCGQFKGLPLNNRASKIAQREVRGDAFLLSNHDDPALDVWERVDTGLEQYEALLAHPPKGQLDPHNAAQMAAMTKFRESESKTISVEDVSKAAAAKVEGNEKVSRGDWSGAVESYNVAVDLTTGRRDLLPNESEATALRTSALLNRSLSLGKLKRFAEAEADARAVLALDSANLKGYYRLVQAQIGLQEFEEAAVSAKQFAEKGGSAEDVTALQQAIHTGAQELHSRQKKMFSKMFA